MREILAQLKEHAQEGLLNRDVSKELVLQMLTLTQAEIMAKLSNLEGRITLQNIMSEKL